MDIVTQFPHKIIDEPDMGIILSDGCRLSARVFLPESATKIPLLLDIFSPSIMIKPLQKMLFGWCSGLKTALWLYSAMVRWLGMRSRPLTRKSSGYQYSNSLMEGQTRREGKGTAGPKKNTGWQNMWYVRIFTKRSAGMSLSRSSTFSGTPKKMKSQTCKNNN